MDRVPDETVLAPSQSSLWLGEDFQHPQATHQVLLGTVRVAYLLERSSRRSIGFQVGPEGLRIRAPRWISVVQIQAAIAEKSRWILEKLRSQQEQAQDLKAAAIVWRNGEKLPYRGGQTTLHLNAGAPRTGSLLAVGEGQWALHLPVAIDAPAAQVRAAVTAWWLREARENFTQRLHYYSPMLGVRWRSLRLSNARTRWGSAKADGSIMLNWRLLHCRQEVIDYVVVHELAHLRHMDHSPLFWAVVRSIQPHYESLRRELKLHASPIW